MLFDVGHASDSWCQYLHNHVVNLLCCTKLTFCNLNITRISLLLMRLPKLPSQCFSNGLAFCAIWTAIAKNSLISDSFYVLTQLYSECLSKPHISVSRKTDRWCSFVIQTLSWILCKGPDNMGFRRNNKINTVLNHLVHHDKMDSLAGIRCRKRSPIMT